MLWLTVFLLPCVVSSELSIVNGLYGNKIVNYKRDGVQSNRKSYKGLNVVLVYHAWFGPESHHWESLVKGQFEAVNRSGLFDVINEFHSTLSDAANNETFWRRYTDLVIPFVDQVTINVTAHNYFEYDGINQVYQSALDAIDKNNTIIGYFHSKGSYHFNQKLFAGRTGYNIVLTKAVMEDWAFYFSHFLENENLFTAGVTPTCPGGAQYHNFWWARASYVSRRQAPGFGTFFSRHYYEFWLNTCKSCHTGQIEPLPNNSTLGICEYKYWNVSVPKSAECDRYLSENLSPSALTNQNNRKYLNYCMRFMEHAFKKESLLRF